MKKCIVFFKKELFEYSRTYKLLILLIVFGIFGILSPLTAKLMPDILGALAAEFSIALPEPTAFDSWAQFFKNISQIGIVVTLVVFSGVLSTEISKGTLINMLTKGLSRTAVIISKYSCMALIWTISLSLCFGLTWVYTEYLFPNNAAINILYSVFCLWLFGVFLISALIFCASLSKSVYAGLLLTGGVFVICTLVNIIPAAHDYNPVSLASDNMGLIMNAIKVSSLYGAIVVAALLSAGFVIAAALVFKKKQL